MTQDDWNNVYSQAFKKLEKLLTEGKSVVFDGGSLLRSERDTLKNISREYNIPYKLVYVNTSKEEIRKRWLKNQKLKARGHVEEETLNKAFEMFEEPADDGEVVIYHPQTPLDKWIRENII